MKNSPVALVSFKRLSGSGSCAAKDGSHPRAKQVRDQRTADWNADEGTSITKNEGVQGVSDDVHGEESYRQPMAPECSNPKSPRGEGARDTYDGHQANGPGTEAEQRVVPSRIEPPHGIQ